MLSRVADSVYWLGRYVERAENVARFIDVNYNLTLGEIDSFNNQWSPLVYVSGDHKDFEERYGSPNRENVLRFLTTDKENANSIASCIASARENARAIRDIIPNAIWEQLNRFHLMVKEAAASDTPIFEPQEFCEQVRLASHLFIGTGDATMSHGEAWHFSQLGRMIERADKTSRLIDVQYFVLLPEARDVGSPLDVVRWSALLKSASALVMYRRVHGRITPEKVANFLILNPDFPRSIHHCVVNAMQSLRHITGSAQDSFCNASEQYVGQLGSRLIYASIEDIIQQGLHEYVDDLQAQLNTIGQAIAADYFSRPPVETNGLVTEVSQS
ncbi:alpha-E domain-containing protein [Mariniblastus fucicola]|uniref:DUF403 domain-containing protein n=1 Tax=Mariniblastus fucicola TaxID=980251 RepID=A0A5B9PDV4_9BACT|nr:alpha-E domain-containing protein [Mariniblastus fucicola]QEG24588.1 hypothetical protein MFFC18_45090 [Mariniblastus fucicola]